MCRIRNFILKNPTEAVSFIKITQEFYMKYFCLFVVSLAASFLTGCGTVMLPAEDIKIFEVCKEEIAVLKNPKIPAQSKEKYEAAISLCKKVDFSYTRTIRFLSNVFLESDAKVNNQGNGNMIIIMYYPYKDKFVSFEFQRYKDHILRSGVRYK